MTRTCLSRWLLVGALLTLPACSPRTPPTDSEQAHDSISSNAPERAKHLADLGIQRWHADGVRGQQVRIAVLDTGFRGYRSFLGNGLPATLRTRSFRKDQNFEARDSQHGIRCAEVLHALAPDAEILLVNWEPDDPHSFLDAVRWAKAQGVRVLSCSLIMPSWSDGEGGGEVHRELDRILGDGTHPQDML
ncbi:MAG TPA: hypothetical protein VFE62_20605, partial [Gemmataceae bacterium]|nr:hypothetical protein [Gemmataceae bacterium]